jgi:hypothetical protein
MKAQGLQTEIFGTTLIFSKRMRRKEIYRQAKLE